MSFLKKIWDIWWLKMTLPLKLTVIGIVLALIAALWLFAYVKGWQVSNWNKKIEKQKETIQKQETNAAVDEAIANMQENRVREKENIANDKSNISKQAEGNYNAVVNRGTDTYDTDYRSAKERFCADPEHRRDPVCKPVR
jgi:cell division protein FtsB